MILKLRLKPTNLFNFLHLDKCDYKGAICDFHDNVTFEELMTFSNKRIILCFHVLTRTCHILFLYIYEATQ